MYAALSGQIAVAKQIDLIANNIANLSTSGFKAERPLFEKVLSNQDTLLTSSLKKDIDPANRWATDEYTNIKGSYADFSQGNIEMTSNPMDVAIQGKGFFVVQTADGERYTRAGSFRLDAAGKMVTQNGAAVQAQGGEITASGGLVSVSEDGTIKVNGNAVGKLRIVDLDTTKLEREPGQLFKLTEGGATDIEKPSIVGGALEGSNVNAVRELADMILASRLFEGFKSVQQAVSKIDQQRNERLGSNQG